jgi:hypothetical protein
MHEVKVVEEPSKRIHISYMFARNIIAIVRELIGNPAFKDHIRYAPERHWTAEDCKIRVYGEAWSGNWWWRMQVSDLAI